MQINNNIEVSLKCRIGLGKNFNYDFFEEFINENGDLKQIYDECLQEVSIFRTQHLQYAADYIHSQNTKSTLFGSGGSKVRGTGGTPFMKYLKKHRDETDKSKIDQD